MRVSCNESRNSVTCYLSCISAVLLVVALISVLLDREPLCGLLSSALLFAAGVLSLHWCASRRAYTIVGHELTHVWRGKTRFTIDLRTHPPSFTGGSIRCGKRTLYWLPKHGRSTLALWRRLECASPEQESPTLRRD